MDAPARELRAAGRRSFVFGIGLEHEVTNALLRRRVGDRTQQGEAATVPIHDVLPCRKRDIAATGSTTLPDPEADQL